MSIILFDTSIASLNKGDNIIMDSVHRVTSECFKKEYVINLPTHEKISKVGRKLIQNSNLAIVGGTNLLTGNLLEYRQWKLTVNDLFTLPSKVVLLGVGWWQYQNEVSRISKFIYKRILSNKFTHSVRDSYTKDKLNSIGIDNVSTTGCPTMWMLNNSHCNQIPKTKADSVVFTLTDYNKNKVADSRLIGFLLQKYEEIYFWPQGSNDYDYLKSLAERNYNKIEILPPKLQAYNKLLQEHGPLDYVGTRLHAGIRALQYQRRTIILAIDNRAREKQKDFNLVVCPRQDLQKLDDLISSEIIMDIKLPKKKIQKWKNQFR